MNTIVSQKMSRGRGNAFLNRLEAAGLNDQMAQKIITSKDNYLATKMVEVAKNDGHEPARSWCEKDGIIYFSVRSVGGATGEEWIKHLEDRCFRVGDQPKQVLRGSDFIKSTERVPTEVAVIRGALLESHERTPRYIRAKANERKFVQPDAELACLIREKLTDEEIKDMRLWWIIAMSEPVRDACGNLVLLGASRSGYGRALIAESANPDVIQIRDVGFAFTLPIAEKAVLRTA